MTGHKIGYQILLFSTGGGYIKELFTEAVVHLHVGLAHMAKNAGGDMLRGYLQLSADVVTHQLIKEGAVIGGNEDDR